MTKVQPKPQAESKFMTAADRADAARIFGEEQLHALDRVAFSLSANSPEAISEEDRLIATKLRLDATRHPTTWSALRRYLDATWPGWRLASNPEERRFVRWLCDAANQRDLDSGRYISRQRKLDLSTRATREGTTLDGVDRRALIALVLGAASWDGLVEAQA